MLRKFVSEMEKISCSLTSCLRSNDFNVSSNHMKTFLKRSNKNNKEKKNCNLEVTKSKKDQREPV